MVDKNLFLYDLSVVAILKNEAPYLKEWLDYHLAAGVDHFFLYDNDSTDNQAEVAAPYVEAGLVDYLYMPGKARQMPTYNDAVKRFKFFSRYITFIDGDEFIYPKTNRPIVEVVDEILSPDPNARGLAINWQFFGANGQETADYSRGVLERFTRRAPDDWDGNKQVKVIVDPRAISFIKNPHYVCYFGNWYSNHKTPNHGDYLSTCYSINEHGDIVKNFLNDPVSAEKIVVNHYYCKSREEFIDKKTRGKVDMLNSYYEDSNFDWHDRNEEFDDGILHYRAARAEIFSLEDERQRLERVTKALTETLSSFAEGTGSDLKIDTALTCRALSTYLREKFPAEAARWEIYEAASLAAIIKSLDNKKNFSEAQLFVKELPILLSLPYPVVKELHAKALDVISGMMNLLGEYILWGDYVELEHMRDLVKLIKV